MENNWPFSIGVMAVAARISNNLALCVIQLKICRVRHLAEIALLAASRAVKNIYQLI